MASRSRFDGTPADLAAAIGTIAKKRSFLQYDEAEKTQQAKTDPQRIADAAPLLAVLHDLHSGLSFPKSVVTNALEILIKENASVPEWSLKPEHIQDYKLTMCRRILNLCRCTSQGMVKHPGCKWVQNLPWNTTSSQPKSETASLPASGNSVAFGYDSNLKMAWKADDTNITRKNSKTSLQKDFTSKILPPLDDDKKGAMRAVWPDGTEWEIAELTLEDWEASSRTSGEPSAVEIFWSGEHIKSHNAIFVKSRQDRSPLISIFEQSSQKLQTKVSDFNSKESCISMMVGLAKSYAADEWPLEQIKSQKAAKMEQLKKAGELTNTWRNSKNKRPIEELEGSSTVTGD